MVNINILILTSLVIFAHSVQSLWDFAITTKNKIIFYDDNWTVITTAAHQFEELSAITFDETEERLFFNDKMHNNGSIFSLKIPLDTSNSGDPHIIEQVLARTRNETIAGIAYDPVDLNLFWTDAENRRIYRLKLDGEEKNEPQVLFDFSEEKAIPDGIAIDVCRRQLYWTNSNHKSPSIERSSLDGKDRETLITSNLFMPFGIAVDMFSEKIYWVVDQEGSHYSVESANLDGSNRTSLIEGLNNVPYKLSVTNDYVFWTDLTHSAVWSVSKANQNVTAAPLKVQSFSTRPKGIVNRLGFLSKMENDVTCGDVVRKIKKRLLTHPSANQTIAEAKELRKKKDIFCLNHGEYNSRSGICICKIGFTGARCETNECHNFCVHGTCGFSTTGFPHCTCQEGFYGERCETYKCADYCLNEGECEVVENVPTCKCRRGFTGSRCQSNSTEICSPFCKLLQFDPEHDVPFGCHDICDELALLAQNSESSTNATATQSHHRSHQQSQIEVCTTLNTTVIIIVVGVLFALLLVFLIIKAIRRIYKPARPRIKKTFVVQKKITQTPMTSRPIATEQCEITIENCCNMNICETPCFDPKLLQQNMAFDNSKEDKKMLINNMEEDLY